MFYDLFFTDILTTGLTFIIVNGIEYVLHKMSHSSKYGSDIYKWHKVHHLIYNKKQLTSDVYLDKTSINLTARYTLYISVGLYFLLPTRVYLIFITEGSIYAVIMDHLHKQYHITDSYLNNYQWFRRNQKLHQLHHKFYNKNLALLSHNYDKLFHSFLRKET